MVYGVSKFKSDKNMKYLGDPQYPPSAYIWHLLKVIAVHNKPIIYWSLLRLNKISLVKIAILSANVKIAVYFGGLRLDILSSDVGVDVPYGKMAHTLSNITGTCTLFVFHLE